MDVDMVDWATVAVQAGGAITVCGMFLLFLKQKQIADDKSRNEFLSHLVSKDAMSADAADKQFAYMERRDNQSKEIAISGHAALNELTEKVAQLRESIRGN